MLGVDEGWIARPRDEHAFDVFFEGGPRGTVQWELLGEHNRHNALAALAAARHAGVPVTKGIEALAEFRNVKRRLEVRGTVNDITLYDDFAHHPTAIETTIAGLRSKVNGSRILAVLEPRSNTMKMGVMKDALAGSLAGADLVFCYTHGLGWDAAPVLAPLGAKSACFDDLAKLTEAIAAASRPGDHVLVMSNGSFGGIHTMLLQALGR
jgi:UDP-N-acetylmuramate: L-alanyl-gamma-D-glutamyl-meso-diaminopimelate ligase